MPESFLNDKVTLLCGDCLEQMALLEDESIDACVTDPPYALVSIVKRFGKEGSAPVAAGTVYARSSSGFMSKRWDTGEVAFNPDFWREVLRVLKPGGHVLAMGGTRTYHRLVCAIEDAGFEVRDCVFYCYGSGFPKSHDIGKKLDDQEKRCSCPAHLREMRVGLAPEESLSRTWDHCRRCSKPVIPDGLGTALKPAVEPCVLARKPLGEKTVAANVLAHGTGAINIDACRVETDGERVQSQHGTGGGTGQTTGEWNDNYQQGSGRQYQTQGRWPANLIHDGSEEVLEAFPETTPATSRTPSNATGVTSFGAGNNLHIYQDATESAARFFYTAKADSDERIGSKHPTVKPVDLMQYLVRLITPPGGTVLDPFAGTGTTGEAAWREGMRAILIEREEEYQADIRRRMELAMAGPVEREHAIVKTRGKAESAGPLFE